MYLDKKEIISATTLARNFSSVIKKMKEGSGKTFVLKNNEINCVILSLEEYEKLCEAKALLEKIYKDNKSGNS